VEPRRGWRGGWGPSTMVGGRQTSWTVAGPSHVRGLLREPRVDARPDAYCNWWATGVRCQTRRGCPDPVLARREWKVSSWPAWNQKIIADADRHYLLLKEAWAAAGDQVTLTASVGPVRRCGVGEGDRHDRSTGQHSREWWGGVADEMYCPDGGGAGGRGGEWAAARLSEHTLTGYLSMLYVRRS